MKVNFNRIIIKQKDDWVSNMIINLIQCKICLNILNDPYDCLCCNQTFCKKCITSYILANKKCPYSTFFTSTLIDNKSENGISNDNENKDQGKKLLDDLRPSTSNINKLINSLSFSCENKKNGCLTELAIEEVNDHIKHCKYKKISNYNNNKTIKDNNNNNLIGLNTFDNLIPTQNKEKLKFQDSCMSFKKVDISDNITTQQGSNAKMMEKIDKIFEMMTTLSIEQRQLSNTRFLNRSPNKSNTHNIQRTEPDNETPKFKSKQLKINTSFKNNSLNSLSSLTSKMETMSKKITTIERTLQTASSLNNQQYSIKQNNDNSSAFTTPSKLYSTQNKNFQFTTSPQSIQNNDDYPNHTITRNISFNLTNSSLHKTFARTMIKNPKQKHNRSIVTNFPGVIPNKKDSNKNKFPVKELFQPILDTSKLETLINDKDNEMKIYLQEKVLEVLKSYLNDLNLNQGSYFIELKDLLSAVSPHMKNNHPPIIPQTTENSIIES